MIEIFKNLETQKIKNDTLYMVEMHKSHILGLKTKNLESEYLMEDTLAQAKENIWIDISQSMTEVWTSIQIIFEQQELITRCREKIEV